MRRASRTAHRLGGEWCRFWHHSTSEMPGVWGRQAPSEARPVGGAAVDKRTRAPPQPSGSFTSSDLPHHWREQANRARRSAIRRRRGLFRRQRVGPWVPAIPLKVVPCEPGGALTTVTGLTALTSYGFRVNVTLTDGITQPWSQNRGLPRPLIPVPRSPSPDPRPPRAPRRPLLPGRRGGAAHALPLPELLPWADRCASSRGAPDPTLRKHRAKFLSTDSKARSGGPPSRSAASSARRPRRIGSRGRGRARMGPRGAASRARVDPLMAPGTRRVRLDRQGRAAPSRSQPASLRGER